MTSLFRFSIRVSRGSLGQNHMSPLSSCYMLLSPCFELTWEVSSRRCTASSQQAASSAFHGILSPVLAIHLWRWTLQSLILLAALGVSAMDWLCFPATNSSGKIFTSKMMACGHGALGTWPCYRRSWEDSLFDGLSAPVGGWRDQRSLFLSSGLPMPPRYVSARFSARSWHADILILVF